MKKKYFLVISILFFILIFTSIVLSIRRKITIEYPDGAPLQSQCTMTLKPNEMIGIKITVPVELTPICGRTLTLNIERYSQSKVIGC